MSEFESVLATFAALVAREVVRELKAGPSDLVPQATSPLGKRRHCAAVRARVARGDSSACIVGRTHYLTPEALREELTRCKAPKRKAPKAKTARPAPRDELAALREELGVQRRSA
jgi:hypothetical protein